MTTPTDTANLWSLVRLTLRSSDTADLDALAKEVFDAIPAALYEDMLRQAIRGIVADVARLERMSNPIATASAMPKGKQPKSWKVTAIRENWQEALHNRVHVAGQWKFLADCTEADLLAAARERQDMAERNAAAARSYEALAALVAAHKVDSVGDLPTDVLAAALGSVAP